MISASTTKTQVYLHLDDKRLWTCQGSHHLFSSDAPSLDSDSGTTSLEDFFRVSQRKVSANQRLKLAICLTVSLLQFDETPWLCLGWRKEHILFLRDDLSPFRINLDFPLIRQTLPSKPANTMHSGDCESALLDLAILLMEIHHHCPFEQWLSINMPEASTWKMDEKNLRLLGALKWYKSLTKAAEIWATVGVCLFPLQLLPCDLGWEDEEFRYAFYKHVVMPLVACK